MNMMHKSLLTLASLIAFPVLAAVNVNTATQSELEAVKGLGPAKAKAIIEYREAHGSFKHLDELDNVKGIGKPSIDKMKGELTVGSDNARN